ncbi:MAG: hypothetical protein HY686_03510 [Chloroflexi bacterium]|nr:hypothetical protein [Chloroflexota bacterium]
MSEQESVFVDGEVPLRIERLVEGARKYVVLVSPYLKLWRHLEVAIQQAAKRRVAITVVLRDDNGEIGGREGKEGVQWLVSNGITVLAVEGLHAKVYMNEAQTMLCSMNLTEQSTSNSMEIGTVVTPDRDKHLVQEYVAKLLKIARPVSQAQGQGASRHAAPTHSPVSQERAGFCIRCKRRGPLDPDYPLCPDCYDEWAEWRNEDYPENVCHNCGKPSKVSYARPLCRQCFQNT